ncbi:hypothetical protein BOTBODRAFT_82826, partial [Botryobasidium botryosum FD-172 SS1]
RMTRESFWHLHSLIQDDPLFLSRGNRAQRPVKYQLTAFLIRFGGETLVKTADTLSIAEGTAYNYVRHVSKSFRNIRGDHLSWPGLARCEFLSNEMAPYGFPGCIGIVDGSLIRLADMPRANGMAYFCRKKFYALAIQAVCDHHGIFTLYEMGWPGSVHDVTIFRQSHIWKEKEKHFRDYEYLLADKGYPLTKFTVRPFAEYDLTNDAAEAERRTSWNFQLSHLRIAIEHAFGRLKGRFCALRMLAVYDLDTTYKCMEALFIVHNILTQLGD